MEETAGYEERFGLSLDDVASYRDFFSPQEWEEFHREQTKGSLTEDDALRMARALDDFELVSVVDLGGSNEHGYWIVVRDHRFGLHYEIASHCDYWDFVIAFVWSLRAANSGEGSALRAERSKSQDQERGSLVRSSVPSAANSRRKEINAATKSAPGDLTRCVRRMLHGNRRLRRAVVA